MGAAEVEHRQAHLAHDALVHLRAELHQEGRARFIGRRQEKTLPERGRISSSGRVPRTHGGGACHSR
jgi:hypothetical protein